LILAGVYIVQLFQEPLLWSYSSLQPQILSSFLKRGQRSAARSCTYLTKTWLPVCNACTENRCDACI
jgi:hypothetical protein